MKYSSFSLPAGPGPDKENVASQGFAWRSLTGSFTQQQTVCINRRKSRGIKFDKKNISVLYSPIVGLVWP